MPERGNNRRSAVWAHRNQTHRIAKTPLPSTRRSTRLQEKTGCVQRVIVEKEEQCVTALLSPSTKNSFNKEVRQNAWPSPPKSTSATEPHAKQEVGQKRKRPQVDEDSGNLNQDNSPQKRTRVCPPERAKEERGYKFYNPVKHWARTGFWPKNLLEMDPKASDGSSESKKKQKTSSYTQSVKDGVNPKAYSREYENHLRDNGIHMDYVTGNVLVSDASKSLCIGLQSGTSDGPDHTSFPKEEFLSALERVRNRNEQRVYRDMTPLIVPSAELLFLNGESELEHLTEEVSADWTKCTTLAGPQPRPDFAIGLMSSIFTIEELVKLKNYTAPKRPTLFTENMYFPFLLCEAKCGNEGIDIADRQNMHSGSIAVNAIIQLYQEADKYRSPSRLQELNRQTLVFSVSHDQRCIRIHGHYALIREDQVTFHRHLIDSLDILIGGSKRWTAYNFTRQIYSKFLPAHLKRIRDALANLGDQRQQSFASNMSFDEPESQESDLLASSSQEGAGIKKPPLPPSVTQQQEQQRQQQEQQRQQQEQQRQQREQYEKQIEQQQQQYKEQIEQQRQQHKEQMEQYTEIIKMLKQQPPEKW